jgi:hypothetical protein
MSFYFYSFKDGVLERTKRLMRFYIFSAYKILIFFTEITEFFQLTNNEGCLKKAGRYNAFKSKR